MVDLCRFPPWIVGFSWLSIRVKVISVFFYLTWISIRCILYPSLLFVFWDEWNILSRRTGSFINILLPSVPLHACFCLLNLKWTYELIMSKIRYLRRRKQLGADAAIDSSVSKGLWPREIMIWWFCFTAAHLLMVCGLCLRGRAIGYYVGNKLFFGSF